MRTNEVHSGPGDAPPAPSREENAICGACGKSGADRIGDGWLCLDCYHESGSCCSLESE